MGVFTDHAHTAITEKINAIIENDLEAEVELPDLLDLIHLQYSGAIEAARAIRKKLKYAALRQQLNSLDLLNALVVNGGRDLSELYNDRKLLERLKESANDTTISIILRKKIIALAISWNQNFSDSKYHTGIAMLKNSLPRVTNKKKRERGRRNFMEDEAYQSEEEEEEDDRPARNDAEANRKYKIPTINLKKEGPKIKALIAEASTASIDLVNSLKTIKRDRGELATNNRRSTILFDKTRIIRRKILRYLQLTDSEEFLGSLIHANEELVEALQLYTEYSLQEDSDEYSSLSEDDESDLQSITDSLASEMIEAHTRSSRVPPRIPIKKIQTDDNNPFGDSNEVDDAADWK